MVEIGIHIVRFWDKLAMVLFENLEGQVIGTDHLLPNHLRSWGKLAWSCFSKPEYRILLNGLVGYLSGICKLGQNKVL